VTVPVWYSSGDIGKAIVAFNTAKEGNKITPTSELIAVSEKPSNGEALSIPCEVVHVKMPAGYKRGFVLLQTSVGSQMHYCIVEWNRSYTKLMPNKLVIEGPEDVLTPAWISKKIQESWSLTG
jgi:hypothetical protein